MIYAIAARVIVWGVIALMVGAFLKSLVDAIRHDIKAHRDNRELRSLYARNEAVRVQNLRAKMQIVDSMKTDAAVPLANAVWQERARRAEALGFIDDDSGPWVA